MRAKNKSRYYKYKMKLRDLKEIFIPVFGFILAFGYLFVAVLSLYLVTFIIILISIALPFIYLYEALEQKFKRRGN